MKSNHNHDIKYDYENIKLSPEDVLAKWKYPGTDALEQRIKNYDANRTDSLNDIVNQIVLWKVNRQVFFDDDTSLLEEIFSLHCPNIDNREAITAEWLTQAKTLIVRLLSCKGIRLPMASTILHFLSRTHS